MWTCDPDLPLTHPNAPSSVSEPIPWHIHMLNPLFYPPWRCLRHLQCLPECTIPLQPAVFNFVITLGWQLSKVPTLSRTHLTHLGLKHVPAKRASLPLKAASLYQHYWGFRKELRDASALDLFRKHMWIVHVAKRHKDFCLHLCGCREEQWGPIKTTLSIHVNVWHGGYFQGSLSWLSAHPFFKSFPCLPPPLKALGLPFCCKPDTQYYLRAFSGLWQLTLNCKNIRTTILPRLRKQFLVQGFIVFVDDCRRFMCFAPLLHSLPILE